jgi:Major intrinsic protein
MFTHVSAGGNYPISTPGGDWRSLVMEMVLTAILVSVILNAATGGRSIGHNAAIAVGATVTLLGLLASPISGASMNPARTLGPDIVGNDYTGWWICILGPVIGTVIAVAIITAVRGLPDKEERGGRPGRRPAHARQPRPSRAPGVRSWPASQGTRWNSPRYAASTEPGGPWDSKRLPPADRLQNALQSTVVHGWDIVAATGRALGGHL